MFRRLIEPAGKRRGWRRALVCALLGASLSAPLPTARAADDPKAAANQLSNQAFVLLNSLNAQGADAAANPAPNPLLGEVASFAGDAQALSQALGAGDNAAAGRAMASLKSDAASLDAALKAHNGALKADQWRSLEQQLAALEKSVPAAPADTAPPTAAPPAADVPASASAAASGAAPAPAPGDSGAIAPAASPPAASAVDSSAGPTIQIESRTVEGDVTHLKGHFEGSALSSAGIYEGAQRVKPIDVDHVSGRQKVQFELSLRDADIATNLRVIDQAGRTATASVFADDSTALASKGTESGVEVDRGAGATSGSNTAEIPSYRASAPPSLGTGGLSESAPGMDEGLGAGSLGGGLGGGGLGGGLSAPIGSIQINIQAVNAINPLSHVYQVIGQIIGHGATRAGIYVDGRLVKRLPVSRGANLSSFNTTFMLNGGTATIRVFSGGNQYVESSISMPAAAPAMPPIVVAPYGMNPYSPYGMNPYAVGPLGIPYGASPSYGYNISPYGITRYPISPYGASPYGAVPYGVNPYAAPINPYGNALPMGPAGR